MEKKLLKRIEELRKKLNKFALTRDLIDSEVVEVSQQLDSLLNQYQRLASYQQLSFWQESNIELQRLSGTILPRFWLNRTTFLCVLMNYMCFYLIQGL